MARFQPIKTLTKLLQTFSMLLSVVIDWKTGHSLHFRKFHKCFASVSRIIVTNYSQSLNKISSPTFTITYIHSTIFLKFCVKILFCYDTVPQLLFFFKSRNIIFTKLVKIFEKFDVVSRTVSISSLKFLVKLVSHYEKLQNMSQVFHPRWETINLRFLSMGTCRTSELFSTCLCTITELCL